MTIQYSIPSAVGRANTFLFDTPIPPGVIPVNQRQPRPKPKQAPTQKPSKSGANGIFAGMGV